MDNIIMDRTADIVITIYQAERPGDRTKCGPERYPTYGGFAGVSLLSTRPEGPDVMRRAPQGWINFREVGGLGVPPCRKIVKIALPDDVHYGEYTIGNVPVTGLHADHSTKDGMGRAVYCWCNVSTEVLESWEAAIDAAIASGITLSVPQPNGQRAEVPAHILSVSDLYGNNAPADWAWSD